MEDNYYINFEDGHRFLANDHLMFLKRFCDVDLEQFAESIKIAHLKKDWIELRRAAIYLKGSCIYLGANRSRAICENLRDACAVSPVVEENVNSLVTELTNHLDSLLIFLRNHFNSNQSPLEEKHSKKPLAQYDSKKVVKEVIVKKLTPPVSRESLIEISHMPYEEEIDAYDEISKQWRCVCL